MVLVIKMVMVTSIFKENVSFEASHIGITIHTVERREVDSPGVSYICSKKLFLRQVALGSQILI